MGHTRKKSLLSGLDRFGLTIRQLTRLGDRPVTLSVWMPIHPYAFPSRAVAQRLLRMSPEDRRKQVEEWCRRAYRRLVRGWPASNLERIGSTRRPWGFVSTVPARAVPGAVRGIRADRVTIDAIKGLRQRLFVRSQAPRWYGAHLVFLFFQVEDRRRGNELVEDRYVMIRARNSAEAWEQARRYGQREWSSSLNRYGNFIRVVLEEVRELYEMFDTPSKPGGVEVFSRMRHRRIRKDQVWRPRVRAASYFERSLERAPRSSKR